MADLNSTLYNGEALGSGSATNAYGGAVVFSGPITQTVSCSTSITIAPLVWHAVLAGVNRCLAWLRDQPQRAAPGDLLTKVSVSGTLTGRLSAHETLTASPSASGALAPRVIVRSLVFINQAVRVVGYCYGDDLSRTPAPDDRVIYVPANDRTSYVTVN